MLIGAQSLWDIVPFGIRSRAIQGLLIAVLTAVSIVWYRSRKSQLPPSTSHITEEQTKEHKALDGGNVALLFPVDHDFRVYAEPPISSDSNQILLSTSRGMHTTHC